MAETMTREGLFTLASFTYSREWSSVALVGQVESSQQYRYIYKC